MFRYHALGVGKDAHCFAPVKTQKNFSFFLMRHKVSSKQGLRSQIKVHQQFYTAVETAYGAPTCCADASSPQGLFYHSFPTRSLGAIICIGYADTLKRHLLREEGR